MENIVLSYKKNWILNRFFSFTFQTVDIILSNFVLNDTQGHMHNNQFYMLVYL